MIRARHRSSEASRRLDDIPGVGPALATALVASVADPKAFRSGRDFSPWIGLVPKQEPAVARTRSVISANEAIAICAACSWPAHSPSFAMPESHGTKKLPWVAALLTRRPTKIAAIALWVAWAMMAKGERYNYPASLKGLNEITPVPA